MGSWAVSTISSKAKSITKVRSRGSTVRLAPAFSFEDDPDTGIYRSGTNRLAASAGGTQVLDLRQDEVEALVNFKKGTFAIDGNFVAFEDGGHWITYDETDHDFGLRAGNKRSGADDVITSNGHGAVAVSLNHQAADPEFKVRIGNSGALGATVTWAKELVAKASGALTWGGHAIWHAGNMGAGSTLDADRLDGQEGAFYRNASNLNAGTVPVARLPGGAGNNLDADLLDGQHGSYYRNAGNLNAGTVAIARLSGTYNISISGNADTVDSLHASSFLRSDADSAFSGLISGQHNSDEQLRLGVGVNRNPYVSFYNQSTQRGWVQALPDRMRVAVDAATGRLLDLMADGRLLGAGSTVWHSGNDGAGSSLDADQLDGLHANAFLQTAAAQEITTSGKKRFRSGNAIPSSTGSQAALEVFNPSAGNDAFMAFHVNGDHAAYFGLDGGLNDFAVGGWSMGAVSHRVWHAGNDGAGSGLDADTLDGVHLSMLPRSDTAPGGVGSIAFLRRDNGNTAAITAGQTQPGSVLAYANANG